MRYLVSPLVLAFAALTPSQVPLDYLVVAEYAALATGSGLRFVDPVTGVITDVRSAPGATRVALSRAATVTIDAANPTSIPFVAGLATTISPGFQRAVVQGNQVQIVNNHTLSRAAGQPNRIEVTSSGILAAINLGAAAGLWLAPAFGGTAVQLVALPSAFDVAVGGNFVFVNSYGPTLASRIDVVDLTTGIPRMLGNAYPPLRALFFLNGVGLFAGTDGGDLLTIDPVSGVVLATRGLFSVAITALTGDSAGQLFALTSANEVYDVAAPGVAVYRSGNRVNDIAFGTVDLASFLIFGDGCGSTAVPPHQATSGVPSVGNAGFSVALVGGQPRAAAFFVFGGSRTTFSGFALPLPLDFLQMPRCWLYSDIIVMLGLSLDAAGNASLPLAIPFAPRLRGRHFTTQWFTADGAANPLGLAASDGAEGIIR